MYDEYNEKGLGRMTLGACFGIGSLMILLFDKHSPENATFLIVTLLLSVVVFLHGYFANKENSA